jgi:NAD-dependent SIR2 family protein deacetylase
MQFYDGGPDVPEDLISAQLAGDVVLVIGAGVSARVGLPLFGELVRRVYARLGQGAPGTPDSLADAAEAEAWSRGEWDRTLGLLEHRLVYPNPNRPEVHNVVREAVAAELQPPRRASVAHRDILDISKDAAGRPRIVTTNFDTLFERAARSADGNRVASSVGPGLAAVGSSDFHGVMHLHGRIANPRLRIAASNLVLTSADFGEAYLRSGWASRFVYDLLRRYTLVFVGYAADDPPMRYMLEATEAGRLHFPDLRRAYAFAPFGEDSQSDEGSVRARWRAKGLVPVLYENRDRSHESLYRSLSSWADCTRDPGKWAGAEIARIASGSFAHASKLTRAKVKYLTTTMANTAVLSNCASSPDWIECLIDSNSPPYLLERDASVWLAEGLADPAAVKWALGAPPTIKAIISRAAQSRLAVSSSPLSNAMYRFWRLFVVAFSDNGSGEDRLHGLGTFSAVRASAADYFTIEGVVEIVRPRLQLAAPWPSLALDGDRPQPSEPTLRDLCSLSFESKEWPTWTEILAKWPQDEEAEFRLLNALGRALAEACELAQEAGLIDASWDQTSREVQLVHVLEPAEAAVPSLAEGHYAGHWQRADIDEDRRSFVPIVRLMSGLWRRLVIRDVPRARAVARSWMEQDFLLFQRLGYWAATVSDEGPIEIAAQKLRDLSHACFWLERHRSAEAARFWCRRWNSLPLATRRTVERHILKGPALDWMALAETKTDKRRAADRARYRELVRITTAGGVLSGPSHAATEKLRGRLENPPSQVSVVEGLRQEMWSGWGRPGDTTLVAEVPLERLLERIAEIEGADPINQDGLWAAVCRQRSGDALGALVSAGNRRNWPEGRWRDYLNSSLMAFKDGINENEVASALRALCDMPADTLAAILPAAGIWLRSLAGAGPGNLREPVLIAWDHLLAALPRWADEYDRRSSSDQRLLEESANHPVGDLSSILITLQDRSPKEPAAGLAADLGPRFEQLLNLDGRHRKLALAPLIRLLPFFVSLAPDWAEENLCQELDRSDRCGRDLLSTLILYGQFYYVQTFNRLKLAISAALLDPETEQDVRDRVAQFITWAIRSKMAGHADINLTEPEARRLLTLSPAAALRSVAWGLWRTLGAAQPDDKRDVWKKHLKPFLERVWPNDVVARDPRVSAMLVKIPAVAGELLPEVVDLVLRLIVPGKINSVEFDFDLHDKPELISRFSHEIFDLVSASIELGEPPPYDLANFLDDVIVAAPNLRDDARYVALRNRLQRP